jgi:FG-GAP repeat
MNLLRKLIKKNGLSLPIVLGLLAVGAVATGSNQTQPPLSSAEAVPEGLTSSDWTSIRAAYEAHRHEAVAVEGGYRTRNPEQQWRTDFDGRGFVTQPDAGGWQWGLELKSYGFPGQKRAIGIGTSMTTERDRVSYLRDEILCEWFVNDRHGLEHGFTLEQSPPVTTANESLEFDFGVRGNLHPEISSGGAALRFVDAEGKTLVTYGELKAWDAEGKNLPARFLAQSEGVRLMVDARGARYPVTVDPLAQQAYLKASNTEANDGFGHSVAVSGDTVVVSAYGEASNATGINGDQSDNSAGNAGAAYVFVRSGGTWSQQAYLKASNTEGIDLFGYSVAVSGDTVVVGAYGEGSKATGIDGDQSDNTAALAGAAYVFVRSGGTWSQQAYLKASNTEANDLFGYSVAVSGDTVVVGAFSEDSKATGINGDQSDNTAAFAGAAYVFVRSGGTWSQQAYLKASNTEANDLFGYSVAVSGDTVVVGAFEESSNATGINGGQTDNSAAFSGAAYVFVRSGTNWAQQAYLKASNTETGDNFGVSLAVSGDTVVVGANYEDSKTTGISGDQSDNNAPASGAAYVFVRSGATWNQQAYLKASNTEAEDDFGYSVAVSGDTVVVAANYESSNATGINGDQSDNNALFSGAAYVFVRDGVTWTQQAYLKASNTGADDNFGISVAVSDNTVVVGADYEASNATGINGDQSDNDALDSGAAYIFALSPDPTPTPTPTPATLGNISTRLRVETGDNVLIGGFIVTGPEPKRVILRAIGPSLPLAGKLADPTLELVGPGGTIASNDNWRTTQEAAIIATSVAPSKDLESAIVATLPANGSAYTAIMRGVNNSTGIGLIEVYDLDSSADSQLANISTRGLVQTGDNVMVGGLILLGSSPQEVLVRAIGPSLPLNGTLADPTLDLYDGNGTLLTSNDNWRDTQEADIMATMIPPTDDAEAAILQTRPPAAYTAIVRGKNGTTGIALVEVYNLQ